MQGMHRKGRLGGEIEGMGDRESGIMTIGLLMSDCRLSCKLSDEP